MKEMVMANGNNDWQCGSNEVLKWQWRINDIMVIVINNGVTITATANGVCISNHVIYQ